MVNNSTNLIKVNNRLSSQIIEYKKPTTFGISYPGPDLETAQK